MRLRFHSASIQYLHKQNGCDFRYVNDFVILSRNRTELEMLLHPLEYFLKERLKLLLHQNKVSIRTLASGVDFLGWVHFPDHRVLRSPTRRRLIKFCANKSVDDPSVISYRGLLRHGNGHRIALRISGYDGVY